jgi:dihydrodipicolinate synthase/N-acetylneuraminate lyase
MHRNQIPKEVLATVSGGTVIPALPLALDASRKWDERRQRALIRYYLDAGTGGLAVGVHSTQFEIRDPAVGLLEPVLSLAADEIESWGNGRQDYVKIAGICGRTEQALAEAELALSKGFHVGLLSLAALSAEPVDALVAHCRRVAEILPLAGFYLQPSVGGRILPYAFWRAFAEIDNVLMIKIAPFNRYQTLDVVRAVAEAERDDDIYLYTGNDDNILVDLLSEFRFGAKTLRFTGGLLGHWAVWTRSAVETFHDVRALARSGGAIPTRYLRLAAEVTDANGAFFDVAHNYRGCIPGIHEVLRRQGLLEGTWCLRADEALSPGQAAEIDRVQAAYPHLNDDAFVREGLARWLK